MGVARCLRNQKITEKIILSMFVFEGALISEVNMALCSLGVSTPAQKIFLGRMSVLSGDPYSLISPVK